MYKYDFNLGKYEKYWFLVIKNVIEVMIFWILWCFIHIKCDTCVYNSLIFSLYWLLSLFFCFLLLSQITAILLKFTPLDKYHDNSSADKYHWYCDSPPSKEDQDINIQYQCKKGDWVGVKPFYLSSQKNKRTWINMLHASRVFRLKNVHHLIYHTYYTHYECFLWNWRRWIHNTRILIGWGEFFLLNKFIKIKTCNIM